MTTPRKQTNQFRLTGNVLFLFAAVMPLALELLPSPTIVQGFAAKNRRKGGRSKGKRREGASFGGFGKPPPTLDEVLDKINTKNNRLPKDADAEPCPCGSGSTHGECCGPLLVGSNAHGGCLTPLQVLQSRYTAFCYRNVGHVIRTTHEECRDYCEDKVAWAKDLDKEGMFDSFEFVGLEIVGDGIDESEKDEDEAFLEFKVRLKGRSLEEAPVRSRSVSSVEGEETVVAERSRFLRDPDSGVWKYAGGDVRSTVKGLEDTTLNA